MIEVGSKIPEITLKVMGDNGPESFNTLSEFANKKVILFAVPGAFTPTCSAAHLPGFVENYQALLNAGVDLVACISVNDAFVMDAWGKSAGADKITMLADGNATFTKAVGLDKDASKYYMGVRSARYAMIIDNGTLTHLSVDQAGLEKTSAESILEQL